jgi:PAS domain S-box-containing protein
MMNRDFLNSAEAIMWQKAMDATHDAIALLDPDFRIFYCNKAMVAMFGQSEEDLLGRHCWEVVHKSAFLNDECPGKRMLITHKRESSNIEINNQFFEVTVEPLYNSNNELETIIHTIHDKTILVRSEIELSHNLSNARAIMEATDEIIVLLNSDGIVLDNNEGHARRFGLHREELIGKNIYDFLDKNVAKIRKTNVQKALETGKTIKGEDFRNGRWTEFSIHPVKVNGEATDRVAVFASDITERKKYEENLLLSEEKYRLLFENMQQGVFYQLYSGEVVDINDAALKMFGIFRDQALGITSYHPDWKVVDEKYNILPPEEHPSMLALSTGKATSKTVGVYNPVIGAYKWLVINAIPQFIDNSGKPYQTFVTMHDISERKAAETELDDKNRLFQTLLDSLPVGVFMVEAETGKPIVINLQASEILGRSILPDASKENLEKVYKAYKLGTNQLYPTHEMPIIKGMDGISSFIDDMLVVRPDGSSRQIEVYGMPVHSADGKVKASLVSFMDITSRKQNEEALRKSENKFRILFEHSPIGKSITSIDGTIQLNKAFCELLGYTEAELEGKKIINITHPDDMKVTNECINHMLDGKAASAHFEKRYLHKSGDVIWADVTVFLERDLLGKPLFFITHAIDITERKRFEEINAARITILNNSYLLDFDELLPDILSEAEKLTRSKISFLHFIEDDQESILLKSWSKQTQDYFCKAEATSTHYPLSKAGVWVDCVHERKPVIHNDYASLPHKKGLPPGHAEVVRELVVPIFEGNNIKAIIGVGNKAEDYNQNDVNTIELIGNLAWDIARRKMADEALAKSESRLRDLNATKDKFFSIIAHDLRSPFNNILGFAAILQELIEEKGYEEAREFTEIIKTASEQAVDLLNNLLEWSRLQTGKIRFKPEKIMLMPLVDELIEFAAINARKKNISLHNYIPEELSMIADPSMISTILRNLISNAIKFTHEGDQINIIAEMRADENVIAVADNGVGMSQDFVDKLFRMEGSASTRGTRNEAGTGLGLLLCKDFIEQHNGKIWVESVKNIGSTFYISVPHSSKND